MIMDLTGSGGLTKKYLSNVEESGSFSGSNWIYYAKENEMAGGVFNPFKVAGHLSPATGTFVELTGTPEDELKCGVYDSTSLDMYLAGGRYLYEIEDLTDYSLAESLDLGATGTPDIRDIEIYQVNGTRKLFYAYNKPSAAGDIGIASLPFASGDDDWLSTTPTGSFALATASDVFMLVADNGFMYVFNGNAVHKIDGTTATGGSAGTATANVLVFPADFNIRSAADYKGNIYIGMDTSALAYSTDYTCTSARVAGIYVWDRFTNEVRMRDFIALNGVRNVLNIWNDSDGNLFCLTIASDRSVQLRRFNGSSFEVIESLLYLAYPKYRDSLTVYGNLTYWLGQDNKIHAFGKHPLTNNYCHAVIGRIDHIVSYSTPGILVPGDYNAASPRTALYTTGYKSSDPIALKFFPNGYGTMASTALKPDAGSIYTPLKIFPRMSTLKYIDLFMARTSGDAGVMATIKIYFNGNTTEWATKTITAADCAKGYRRIEINKPFVNSVQMLITYDSTTTMTLWRDFMPSYAVVNYEPTETAR